MDAFLTILLWLGSGFALAVGVFIGALLMAYATGSRTKNDALTAEVNELLKKRNEIGERQAVALERLADYADAWIAFK